MEDFSIADFQAYCSLKHPREFVLSTNRQDCWNLFGIKCNLIFDHVRSFMAPDAIFFTGDKSNLMIDHIRKIVLKEEPDDHSSVIEISCGNFIDTNRDVSYTVILQN